jgi:imidazolonepropionase
MSDRVALTNCSQVLTNSGPPVLGGTVLISAGRVIDVVPGGAPSGFESVDIGGRCVTPGLVDAHTHAVFAGSRANETPMRAAGATYQEIAEAGGGIMSTMRAVRECDGDQLFEESKRHAEWMLACGTTTAEMKSGYGLSTLHELKMLDVVRRIGQETPLDTVGTFLGAHAVPPEFAGNRDGYIDLLINETLPLVVSTGTATAVDIFVEQGYFDAADAARLAGTLALPLRMHVDQFSTGGAELAAALGAKTADHLEQTGPEGIEALADAGVIPVLLPASVHCLGLDRYPDARRMIDFGMPVVVATDFNPGSSPTPSLPFAMSLACTKMGMAAMEALQGCTANAARALGRGDIGVLAPGARADIVVWDTDSLDDVPYFVSAPLVWAVYKDGERIRV